MATKFPVDFLLNGEIKTVILNSKERALFRVLDENNGDVVMISDILKEMEIDKNYLRVIKKSLQEKLEGLVTIISSRENGYFIRYIATKL